MNLLVVTNIHNKQYLSKDRLYIYQVPLDYLLIIVKLKEWISTCRFQWLYAYPLDTFWHKFGDNRFLWLQDMTSYGAGGQAIFWVKMRFSPFLGDKSTDVDKKKQSA